MTLLSCAVRSCFLHTSEADIKLKSTVPSRALSRDRVEHGMQYRFGFLTAVVLLTVLSGCGKKSAGHSGVGDVAPPPAGTAATAAAAESVLTPEVKPAVKPETQARPIEDVTRPGDTITSIFPESPVITQRVEKAIDDDPNTKFFNMGTNKDYAAPMNSVTGVLVTPSVGPTVVTGLALTSGDDTPERDPTSYRLEGSNDGTTYSLIATGPVPTFNGRKTRQEILFANPASFIMYRLTFPTIADATTAIAMQIS
jgi:hypothetical protein